MKKSLMVGALLLLCLLSLTACTGEEAVPPKEEYKAYSEELSGFLHQNMNEPLYFVGSLDYVHSLMVKEQKVEDDKQIITSEVALYNLIDETEDEDFYKQELVYTVDNNSVIEQLEQAQYDDPKNFVTNKIVLKTPLKEGTRWTQKVKLGDSKEYIAQTSIVKIIGEKGEREVSTVTTISGEGFDDYPNNQYKEKSVYQEGKGLVSFERFYPNENGGFIFNYHVAKEK